MRILAFARYRLLRTIRSGHGMFAAALLLAAFPLIVANRAYHPPHPFSSEGRLLMTASAFVAHVAWMWHLLVIVGACLAIGSRRRQMEGQETLDLTETVPSTPADRFWGDAAGILACVLAIHLCVAPVLVLSIVLSPLPSSVFFRFEAAVLALAVLASAGASWNLHARTRWSHTRLARSLALFVALLVVVLRLTTRWQPFADAWAVYFAQPSQASWEAVGRTIVNPPMFVACLVLLYAGFIAYYAAQAVRHLERRQET